MQRALAAFRAIFGSLWRDERGATMAITAVMMTALLAITGLAVDAGWWYALHRQNQSAADAAALSAAYEILNNSSYTQSNLVPYATTAAQQNGYKGSTPEVTYPYSDSLVTRGVEVRLHQPQSTWFAAFANIDNVTISNRAVAEVTVLDSSCTYVLDPSASQALTVSGSGSFSSPGCSVCVNSDSNTAVFMRGANNSVMTADALLVRGAIDTSTGKPQLDLTKGSVLGYKGCTDPYADVLTHDFLTKNASDPMPKSGTCSPATANGVTTYNGNCVIQNTQNTKNPSAGTLPGSNIVLSADTTFLNGLVIKGQTVDLSPGTYWIADGNLNMAAGATLKCSACTPGGAGVTIVLTTVNDSGKTVGNITTDAQAVIDSLNAPGSGTFDNLLLIQDSSGFENAQGQPASVTLTNDFCTGGGQNGPSSCSKFLGGPNQAFTGLIYFPDTRLTFQGTPTVNNSCLMTVADTLVLNGNSNVMATDGCPTTGPGAKKQVYTVSLME